MEKRSSTATYLTGAVLAFMDGRGALRLFGGAGPGRRDLLAAALQLDPAQREQDGTHREPAQQFEHAGPGALPAEVDDAAEGVRRPTPPPTRHFQDKEPR